jgi:hypothetical protein
MIREASTATTVVIDNSSDGISLAAAERAAGRKS